MRDTSEGLPQTLVPEDTPVVSAAQEVLPSTRGEAVVSEFDIDAFKKYYAVVVKVEDGLVVKRKARGNPFFVPIEDVPMVLKLNREAWPNAEKKDIDLSKLPVLTDVVEAPQRNARESNNSGGETIDALKDESPDFEDTQPEVLIRSYAPLERYGITREIFDVVPELQTLSSVDLGDIAAHIEELAREYFHGEAKRMQEKALQEARKKAGSSILKKLYLALRESLVVDQHLEDEKYVEEHLKRLTFTHPELLLRELVQWVKNDESPGVYADEREPRAYITDAHRELFKQALGAADHAFADTTSLPISTEKTISSTQKVEAIPRRALDTYAKALKSLAGYEYAEVTPDGRLIEVQKDSKSLRMTLSIADARALIRNHTKDRKLNTPDSNVLAQTGTPTDEVAEPFTLDQVYESEVNDLYREATTSSAGDTAPSHESTEETEKMGQDSDRLRGEKLISSYEAALKRHGDVAQTEGVTPGVDTETLLRTDRDEILEPRAGFVPRRRREAPIDIEDARIISESGTRTREDITREIAELTTAHENVAYSNKGFLDKYPELKAAYEAAGSSRDAAAYMWIQKRLATLRGELAALTKTEATSQKKEGFFDTRFATEFGITREELSRIPGIEKLSPPQQKLVLENLREYAAAGDDTLLKRGWSWVTRQFGGEGNRVALQGSRGMGAYGDVVTGLIASMAAYGPKVHESSDGKLSVALIDTQPDRLHRPEQREALTALNEAAHAFSKIPSSWQSEGRGTTIKKNGFLSVLNDRFSASRKQYREYEAREKVFEDAKRAYTEAFQSKEANNAGMIARELIDLDAKVFLMRTADTNPEFDAAINEITDESLPKRIGNGIASGVGYAALGAGTRYAFAQAVGWLSGPLVAAGFAGARSWNKAAAEQREQDRKALMGKGADSDLALNIVQAAQTVQLKEGLHEMGATARLERALTAYQKAIEEGWDEKTVNALLVKLKARAAYNHDKLRLNRVQFGEGAERLLNQARFFEILGEAQAVIADRDSLPKSALEERLGQYMRYREGAIDTRRRNAQIRSAAWGATKAAGFSLAGLLAMDWYKDGELNKFLKEQIGNLNGEVRESLRGTLLGRVLEDTEMSRGSTMDSADSALPSPVPTPEQIPPYTIVQGDTLIGITDEHVPTLQGKSEGEILRFLRSLTPEELERVGVSGGDIDRIYSGRKLNLAVLEEIAKTRRTT